MAQVGLLEDNIRIARLCATMLQYAGHQVTVYEHPRKCLEALLLQPAAAESRQPISKPSLPDPTPLDVLIMDLNLPDINGKEVVTLLRSDPRTCTLPLIFCTAASSSELLQVLRLTPNASFIGKPFTFQELVSVVSDVLNEKEQ